VGIDVILVPDRAVNVCKQQFAGLCPRGVVLLTAYLLQKITIISIVPHRQTERQTGTHTHIHAQTNTTHTISCSNFSIRAVPRVAFQAYKHSFAVKRRFDSRPKLFESRLQENTAVTAIFWSRIPHSKWSSLVFPMCMCISLVPSSPVPRTAYRYIYDIRVWVRPLPFKTIFPGLPLSPANSLLIAHLIITLRLGLAWIWPEEKRNTLAWREISKQASSGVIR